MNKKTLDSPPKKPRILIRSSSRSSSKENRSKFETPKTSTLFLKSPNNSAAVALKPNTHAINTFISPQYDFIQIQPFQAYPSHQQSFKEIQKPIKIFQECETNKFNALIDRSDAEVLTQNSIIENFSKPFNLSSINETKQEKENKTNIYSYSSGVIIGEEQNFKKKTSTDVFLQYKNTPKLTKNNIDEIESREKSNKKIENLLESIKKETKKHQKSISDINFLQKDNQTSNLKNDNFNFNITSFNYNCHENSREFQFDNSHKKQILLENNEHNFNSHHNCHYNNLQEQIKKEYPQKNLQNIQTQDNTNNKTYNFIEQPKKIYHESFDKKPVDNYEKSKKLIQDYSCEKENQINVSKNENKPKQDNLIENNKNKHIEKENLTTKYSSQDNLPKKQENLYRSEIFQNKITFKEDNSSKKNILRPENTVILHNYTETIKSHIKISNLLKEKPNSKNEYQTNPRIAAHLNPFLPREPTEKSETISQTHSKRSSSCAAGQHKNYESLVEECLNKTKNVLSSLESVSFPVKNKQSNNPNNIAIPAKISKEIENVQGQVFRTKIDQMFYNALNRSESLISKHYILKKGSVGVKTSYNDSNVKYNGDYLNNQKHGFGLLSNHLDQKIYIGDWKFDKYHGQGVLYNTDLEDIVAKAEINYEKIILTKTPWKLYEGEFQNGEFHGMGSISFVSGERLNGKFIEGKLDGEGSFYQKDGVVVMGVWSENVLKQIL